MPFEHDDNVGSSSPSEDPVSLEISRMKQRLSGFETEKGRLNGLSYQPRSHDIGISTTPKAGTTWVQQICHQLRCAAVGKTSVEECMDFEEISAVVPWIELAYDQGQDLEADQPPIVDTSQQTQLPRFFKTHCWYNHCPPFPKTIVVLRNPHDVVCSFYRFFEGWFFTPGSITLDAFAEEFWLGRGVPDETKMQNASYFVHLVSWYQQATSTVTSSSSSSTVSDRKILLICFEDLKADLEGSVRTIARFISNETYNFATDDIVAHAVAHSTFAFMKEHESHFDERLSKLARNEACGLPKDAGMNTTKINSGKSNHGKAVVGPRIASRIQEQWTKVVFPVTGCASYDDLRAKINNMNAG